MDKKLLRKTFFPSLIILLLVLAQSFQLQAASTDPFEISEVKFCRNVDKNRNPGDVTSKFPQGTQTIYAWFSWKNAPRSQKITAGWHYVSEDIHILDTPITLTRRTDQGVLSLKMPKDKSLPEGSYRLDIAADGKVLKSASFTVLPRSSR